MRLLNVQTRIFEQFYADAPAYAIASHRWAAASETSYQDVQKQRNTEKAGYKKVEGFVQYVKTHVPDVEWLWIDTCCIDQKDSAELSEAVNSMFQWYQKAVVCLAYLADVSDSEDEDEFRRSEWFRRGWTLQELIASKTVIFLTKDWQAIGHKGWNVGDAKSLPPMGRCLTQCVAQITGVPDGVLDDSRRLEAFSKEERLRWVHGRNTTREEDMAYCLFGILDAPIGANYGEGAERARRRLLIAIELMDADAARARPSLNVPFRREPGFIPRPTLAAQMEAKLAPAARVALVGLGGVGKSQLAIEHCYRTHKLRPDTWVFWLHASNAVRFEQSARDLADLLQVSGREDPNADVLQLLRNWLRDASKGSWLMVLDNVDDASFLLEPPPTTAETRRTQRRIDFVPFCEHGSVLITSRSESEALKMVYEDDVVHVMPMNEEEARSLLVSKVKGESADDGILVRALDYMPLAIAQAAAYIRERGPRCSVQQYLKELEQNRTSRTSLLRRHVPLPSRDAEASNAVMLTWQISFEHIYKTQKSAAELLSVMSFCDRLAIQEILIRADGADTDPPGHSSTFEDDIVTLRNFSLVSETPDPREWEMHRLVQDATQVWLEELGRCEEAFDRFIDRLCEVFPTCHFENWALCRTLFPHAIRAAERKPVGRDAQLQWSTILYKSGRYASEQGDFAGALSMATQSMAVRSAQLGDKDEMTLWSKAMVASTYRKQGRWTEAEELELEVVETSKATLGADHPDTLTTMGNLASTYWAQGRWAEAEALGVEVMETSKTTLGAFHPDTLTSIANLALTYSNQGRLAKAEALEVEVIETRKATLGQDHFATLLSMANLAATYRKQGRLTEAEALLKVAVKGYKTKCGLQHPDTILALSDLASIQEMRS
ncbi:hypothetical protein CKM354_001283800 [Cercospora kikuchii]|uniref:Uncharacterized protein n=1 Tax=Cercospora kikuchii TaxID=84275 RepID=A0A9P3L2B6_9PEZI|nr:uncharacterized protein CKM354_001283800 [Cercospora kikuchii]GIZ49813.1 hypothetical protein CKM354_001283800 [Cercospora kikuchii]